ncbi:MAG: pantoate--beta-alanine ligase [Leptospiraceae bacterium]|nr:pantoate--beta-alanine ligase [Leptospiraceae bacterium]MCP5503012.1 pantoate--beta-alanine ligase [Leptospiraceae bacterium]
MEILRTRQELRNYIKNQKRKGKTIGFVPTMGFLHEGHITLFKESVKKSDVSIASIFVNPTQFNNPEDFEKYPRNEEEDCKKAKEAGMDAVFIPTASEIYPEPKPQLEIRIPHLMKNLCATTRPGHFEGVLLVISILFHLVEPDFVFFGKKDFQQYLIIAEYARSLMFSLEVIPVDTVREEDGLAMSSRNARLSEQERKEAGLIPRAFKLARGQYLKGERNAKLFREIVSEVLLSSPLIKIDYLEVLDSKTLEPVEEVNGDSILALAAFAGSVRLIDNMFFRS